MLTVSVIILCYVALSGLVMGIQIFRGIKPFGPLALGHGIFAAMALTLLLIAAIPSGGPPLVKYAAAILGLAALGGAFAVSFHLRGKIAPLGVVVVHGLVALAGLGGLLLYWLA